jgi:acetyl esterase/lipase
MMHNRVPSFCRTPRSKTAPWPLARKGQTRIRVIRPEGAEGPLPVIIYFHGAGWVMGDTTTHDRLVRQLAVGAHAAVIFVDYDRSPEARYPVAIEEDNAVAKYVAEHPGEFNIDASRLAIAGDSVGGNMTAGGQLAGQGAQRAGHQCRTIVLSGHGRQHG